MPVFSRECCGARRQVAAKDHAEFINNMELIDTMPPPGLYEILITEKPANPSASSGEAPDFELCIEPRSLDDIRALGCNSPEDEREFAAVARVSELNNALNATYLQPCSEAEPTAAQLLPPVGYESDDARGCPARREGPGGAHGS